jgi:hypothetical protein
MIDLSHPTDVQWSIFYFIFLVVICIIYKFELKNKRDMGPLNNYDKYYCKSSIKSLGLIILFTVLFVLNILKAIF